MIVIRDETASDYQAVHRVNELAFGRPDEANLVDSLRNVATGLISLVAVMELEVVGHILFSHCHSQCSRLRFSGDRARATGRSAGASANRHRQSSRPVWPRAMHARRREHRICRGSRALLSQIRICPGKTSRIRMRVLSPGRRIYGSGTRERCVGWAQWNGPVSHRFRDDVRRYVVPAFSRNR